MAALFKTQYQHAVTSPLRGCLGKMINRSTSSKFPPSICAVCMNIFPTNWVLTPQHSQARSTDGNDAKAFWHFAGRCTRDIHAALRKGSLLLVPVEDLWKHKDFVREFLFHSNRQADAELMSPAFALTNLGKLDMQNGEAREILAAQGRIYMVQRS